MGKKAAGKSFLSALYSARVLADKGIRPCDPEFEARWPALWLLMTETEIDAKRRCDPGQIILYTSCGDWAAKATSPGLRGSKTIMAASFDQLLPKLDKALMDESIPWQFWLKRKPSTRKISGDGNGLDNGSE